MMKRERLKNAIFRDFLVNPVKKVTGSFKSDGHSNPYKSRLPAFFPSFLKKSPI